MCRKLTVDSVRNLLIYVSVARVYNRMEGLWVSDRYMHASSRSHADDGNTIYCKNKWETNKRNREINAMSKKCDLSTSAMSYTPSEK